jgi:ligand-binding sensor domain-containing protein
MKTGSESGVTRGTTGAGGRAAAFALLLALLPFVAGAADVRVLTTADGLPSNWVTALAPVPGGALWVGTGNAGVYLLDPATGKGKGYRVSDGLVSDEVTSVALFGGKVYVGTASGLSVFDGGKWSAMTTIGNVTMRNVRLAASPDGKELWACSVYLAGGTVKFDGMRWEFMGGKGRGLFNDIHGFAFLPGGVVMASGSGVPYLHTGSDVKVLDEGLPPGSIFSLADSGEALFLGSSRGLFRYEGKWKEIPLPAGFAGSPVFSIAAASGAVIAGLDKGLVKVEAGQARTLTEETGLPASRVTAVAITGDLVVAGTARGLALVKKW